MAGADDVASVISFVRAQWRSNQWLELNFNEVGESQAQRVNTYWAEVLSNALVAELGRARIRVQLPRTDSGLKAFARSGLLFALSQRSHELTEIVGVDGPTWAARAAWARNWSPTDGTFYNTLFKGDEHLPDQVIQREFVTFLNPHLRVEDGELVEDFADTQVLPWAHALLTRVGLGLKTDDRHLLGSALSRIAVELILNIGHAFRRQTGLRGQVPPLRQRCYVQVYITEGGGRESHNRLHFVVADVGHGIMRTLRPKLEVVDRDFKTRSATEILDLLLRDALPEFGRASGLGYKRIVDTVRTYHGQLRVTTGSYDEKHDLDVVRAEIDASDHSDSQPAVTEHPELWFTGTTAHATIPLQPRPRS